MTPDRPVSEEVVVVKPRRRKRMVLLALILGFYIGSVFDSTLHRNYITFEVARSNTRVNLVPKKNDVINWITQTTYPNVPDDVKVTMQGNYTPCTKNGSLSHCEISGESGLYEYHCDSPHPCLDPGLDPTSTTDTGLVLTGFHLVTAFAENLVAPFRDLGILFRDFVPISIHEDKNVVVKSTTHDLNPAVSCVSGVISVNEDPIFANKDDVISWTAGPRTNTFTITPNPAATCSTDSITSATSNPFCKVQLDSTKTAPYSVPYTIVWNGGTPNTCTDTTPHSLTINPTLRSVSTNNP